MSETVANSAEVLDEPLSADELNKLDAYWRAANYLSVGQIYLFDNPLLQEPLKPEGLDRAAVRRWTADGGYIPRASGSAGGGAR